MMKKYMDKNKKKRICMRASYTVEAAMLVPLVIFVIAGGIRLGERLFEETKQSAAVLSELQELNPVKTVRRNTWLKERISSE